MRILGLARHLWKRRKRLILLIVQLCRGGAYAPPLLLIDEKEIIMAFSKSELESWRDDIIAEMKRITKAPGSITGQGASLDNLKRMTLLEDQLAAVNNMLSLVDGTKAVKLAGIDS